MKDNTKFSRFILENFIVMISERIFMREFYQDEFICSACHGNYSLEILCKKCSAELMEYVDYDGNIQEETMDTCVDCCNCKKPA